jgi:hypothetical protein
LNQYNLCHICYKFIIFSQFLKSASAIIVNLIKTVLEDVFGLGIEIFVGVQDARDIGTANTIGVINAIASASAGTMALSDMMMFVRMRF